jgi:hypothetical protein
MEGMDEIMKGLEDSNNEDDHNHDENCEYCVEEQE